MFNLLIHTALGLVSFSRCQVPRREVVQWARAPRGKPLEGRFFVVPKTSKSQKVLYLQLSFYRLQDWCTVGITSPLCPLCWSGLRSDGRGQGDCLIWALEAGRVYEMIIPIIGGQAAAAPFLWMETRIFLFLTFWWNLPGKFLGLVKLCWADAQTGRMLLGQDQKSYGCDKGRLQMRKNCPLLSWFHTFRESTPCKV